MKAKPKSSTHPAIKVQLAGDSAQGASLYQNSRKGTHPTESTKTVNFTSMPSCHPPAWCIQEHDCLATQPVSTFSRIPMIFENSLV